jgi:ABC-type uncharacterized transport system involved in gliding motility auxiliary subunit
LKLVNGKDRTMNIKKSIKYSFNTFFTTVLVLGIIVVVLMLSHSHNKRFDLTEEKKFTLSEQTIKMLNNLDQEVTAIIFHVDGGAHLTQANQLLDQYRYHSKKFKIQPINTNKEPLEARKYNLSSPNALVLRTEDKQEVVSRISEEDVTNALIKILSEGRKTVYFTIGHGERDIGKGEEDQFSIAAEALRKSSYDIKTINLMKEAIPPDCDLLVIAGPKTDLIDQELQQVKNYLHSGGSVFVMLETVQQYSNLNSFLTEKGLRIDNDIIIDPMSNQLLGSYFMPVGVYGRHKIVENFNIISFFLLARSLTILEEQPDNIFWTSFVNSSPSSLSKPDDALKSGGMEIEKSDRRGPFTIAAAASWSLDEEAAPTQEDKQNEAKIIVAGNTNFASNQFFNIQGNGDLFLNSVSWLTEKENLISIRPKDVVSASVFLTSQDKQTIMLVSLGLLPLTVILAGVVAYINRD